MTNGDEAVEWLVSEPVLHEPVMVVMLTGWIDAAGAAAGALDVLSTECDASPIIRFDDDVFIDYRARRPTMELRDGVNTNLRWATIEMLAGTAPSGRDVVLLSGPEPDAAWHRFGPVGGAPGTGAGQGNRLRPLLLRRCRAPPAGRPHRRSV